MAKFEVSTIFKVEGMAELRQSFNELEKSAKDLKKSFGEFGQAVGESIHKIVEIGAAAAGAVAGVAALAVHNAELNKHLVELGQETGLSTDKLQELRFVGEQVGVSQDTLSASLKKFTVEFAKLHLAHTTEAADLEKSKDGQEKLNSVIAKANAAYQAGLAAINRHTKGHQNLNDVVAKENALALKRNATIEAAQGAYTKLTDKLDEADTGEGSLAKTLAKINPELAAQLRAATTADQGIEILLNGLRGTNSEMFRNLIAVQAFGRGNIEMAQFVRRSSEEIKALETQAHRLGVVLGANVLENSVILADKVEALHAALRGLSGNITGTLQPALIIGSQALLEFIANNRERLLDFINNVVIRTTQVITDLFQLFSGAKTGTFYIVALKIFDSFVKIKDAANAALPVIQGLFDKFNALAKALGFASGQQALFIFAALKFTGILGIITAGFGVVVSIVGTFISLIKFIPSLLGVIFTPLGLLVTALALIGTAIFFLVDKTIGWGRAFALVKEGFNFLTEGASVILSALLQRFSDLGGAIKNLFLAILGPELVASFKAIIDEISALGLFQTLEIEGRKAFAALSVLFIDLIDQASIWLATTFDNIVTTITTVAQEVINTISSTISSVFNSIESTVSGIIDSISSKIASITSSIGGIIDSTKNFFGFGATAAPEGFASGGPVRGPGTSRSDSIWGRLSDGEFVVQANAVRKLGVGFLHAINSGVVPMIKGFANGGLVSSLDSMIPSMAQQPAFASVEVGGPRLQGRPLTLVLPNGKTIQTFGVDENTAKQLEKQLRSSAIAKTTSLPTWYK